MAYINRTSLAKFYDVTPQTTRNWQKQGKIPEPSRSPSGRAVWDADLIRRAPANDLSNVTIPETSND